jgi:hypothetical protein
MINLTCQPELFVKCLLGSNSKNTVKNALHLSTTSKIYQGIINSEKFFKGFVDFMGEGHFLPKLNPSLSSFKDRYFELRNVCVINNKNFPGAIMGGALINGEDVELFSFDKGISSLILKENEMPNSIVIPEHMQIEPEGYSRPSPFVARSEKYLAICNKSDSCVYIFNPDGLECLAKHQVPEILSQIALQDSRLYLVMDWGMTSQIRVIDLDNPKENFFLYNTFASQSPRSICFGKEYLTYSIFMNEIIETIAIPLSYFITGETLDLSGGEMEGTCYLFSSENAFIEVIFRELFVCDIRNISFEEDQVQIKMIKEGLVLSKGIRGNRMDVCFSENRLVFAYEIAFETELFSYDFISEQTLKLTTIDQMMCGSTFRPRFLCMAENIYYLFMRSIGENNYKSNLTTLSFSKI